MSAVPSSFKAAVMPAPLSRHTVDDRSLAPVGPNEVAIHVTATAINPVRNLTLKTDSPFFLRLILIFFRLTGRSGTRVSSSVKTRPTTLQSLGLMQPARLLMSGLTSRGSQKVKESSSRAFLGNSTTAASRRYGFFIFQTPHPSSGLQINISKSSTVKCRRNWCLTHQRT